MFKKSLKTASATALLLVSLVVPSQVLAVDYTSNTAAIIAYLASNQQTDGKISGFGGETSWTIMGLSANGIDPHTMQNGDVSLVDFLKNNPPADTAVTAWERDLLAVTAASENPFTFGGRNYVAKVESFASSGQIGSITAINDDIFGILSLISSGPSANQQIISDSVDFLISNQNSDGGWSYQVGLASDSNDTAVAIQALKAAKSKGFSNSGLKQAIDNGVAYLLSLQQPDGGWEYQSGFGTDGASTAWAIQAILGNSSEIEDGLAFLASLQDSSGGVQYQSGFGADTFTSSYALSAFAQRSFPVGEFSGTYEQPQNEPKQTDQNQNNQQNSSASQDDSPGQVLAASTSNNNGKVLAATLPDTGIEALIPKVNDEKSLTSAIPVKKDSRRNKTLLFSLLTLESGFILWLVSGRFKKNSVNCYK